MNIDLPFGTSALIVSKTDTSQFVAVHRKEDATLVCFPGGKLESAESMRQAIAREVREETGLVIAPEDFQFLYDGLCEGGKDGRDYFVATFIVYVDSTIPFNPEEDDMLPFWTNKEEFLKSSIFANYNNAVFEAYETYRLKRSV